MFTRSQNRNQNQAKDEKLVNSVLNALVTYEKSRLARHARRASDIERRNPEAYTNLLRQGKLVYTLSGAIVQNQQRTERERLELLVAASEHIFRLDNCALNLKLTGSRRFRRILLDYQTRLDTPNQAYVMNHDAYLIFSSSKLYFGAPLVANKIVGPNIKQLEDDGILGLASQWMNDAGYEDQRYMCLLDAKEWLQTVTVSMTPEQKLVFEDDGEVVEINYVMPALVLLQMIKEMATDGGL